MRVASSRMSPEGRIFDPLLQRTCDQPFVHGEHDDLVVGKQAFLHGPAKAAVEEHWAEDSLIIHGREGDTQVGSPWTAPSP